MRSARVLFRAFVALASVCLSCFLLASLSGCTRTESWRPTVMEDPSQTSMMMDIAGVRMKITRLRLAQGHQPTARLELENRSRETVQVDLSSVMLRAGSHEYRSVFPDGGGRVQLPRGTRVKTSVTFFPPVPRAIDRNASPEVEPEALFYEMGPIRIGSREVEVPVLEFVNPRVARERASRARTRSGS